MTGAPDHSPDSPGEIRLLTFTVGGMILGVDADQIDRLIEPVQAASEGIAVHAFHEIVPVRGSAPCSVAPRVLVVKNPDGPYGVLIDRPEEIIPVPLDFLRPLPPLLLSCRSGAGKVWGALVQEKGIILLIDFHRRECGGAERDRIAERSEAKR